MEIKEFCISDIDRVFEIQRAAFRPLYDKYRDEATNPCLENRELVLQKYTRAGTKGYLFLLGAFAVGAVRISFSPEEKSARISSLAVHPDFQGRGLAQKALLEIEKLHPEVKLWKLSTIMQEAGNCHLYEKLGYRQKGQIEHVNSNMSLVYYEKRV